MKPSAPTTAVYWIGIILGLLGLVATFVSLGILSTYASWLLLLGWLALALGTSLKGL